MRNQQASLRNLEHQMVQIAKTLTERPQGSLWSNIEVNPRKSFKAVTLRSNKELVSPQVQETKKKSWKFPKLAEIPRQQPVIVEVDEETKNECKGKTRFLNTDLGYLIGVWCVWVI